MEYIIVHHSGAEEIERDGIDTRGYYIVVKQEIEWDGGLSAKLTGRMVSGA